MLRLSFYTEEKKPLPEPTIDGHCQYHANTTSPKQISCYQVGRPNTDYILALAYLGQLFAAEVALLNLSVIFKSHRGYRTTFIGDVGWLINLEREAIVFLYFILLFIELPYS